MTTADRVLEVLTLFRRHRTEWSVEEAAIALDLPTSTVYRYFKSLGRAGLISAYLPGRYVLGPAIIELDREMRLHDPMILAAHEEMSRLARKFGSGCVVLLSRLYHHGVICIHQAAAGRPVITAQFERGRLMPLDRGASSKVILANLPAHVVRQLSQAKPVDDLDPLILTAELRQELAAIRARGYSITHNELGGGSSGVAVPIVGADRVIQGGLSIAVASERTDIDTMVDPLIYAGKAVEAKLAATLARDGRD